MYPTPNCHAHHTRDNVAIVETSDHLRECDASPQTHLHNAWKEIYKEILEKQPTCNITDLEPFGLLRRNGLTLKAELTLGRAESSRPAPPPGSATAAVAGFPVGATQRGLIPRQLEQALKELGVNDPRAQADRIADAVQRAIVADLAARCASLNEGRRQVAAFRHFVREGKTDPLPEPKD